MENIGSNAAVITVNNVNVAACSSGVGVQQNNNTIGVNIYVKQGQTVSMRNSASYQLSAYSRI